MFFFFWYLFSSTLYIIFLFAFVELLLVFRSPFLFCAGHFCITLLFFYVSLYHMPFLIHIHVDNTITVYNLYLD